MNNPETTKVFHVEIVETLRKTVSVELPAGSSNHDAIMKVRDMYNAEEIVLSADDFCDADIYIAENE